jgi:alpha-glucuronidase
MQRMSRMGGLAAALILMASVAAAEDGSAGWLRYERIIEPMRQFVYSGLSGPITSVDDSVVIASARNELRRGLSSLLGRDFGETPDISKASVVLGTADTIRRRLPSVSVPQLTNSGAFWLGTTTVSNRRVTIVAGRDDRGVLYGAFAFLRHVALYDPVDALNAHEEPAAPLRWTNEWDNLDGAIERGYAGRSIFFESGQVAADLTRAGEYARLLASVGVNGCAVNNVNADARAIAPEFVPQLARIADAFRPWGVALAISIDFSSPMKIGGLETFDPLDPRVAAYWKSRVDDIYRAIPDFGGFVLKADSEGRLGPSAYRRSHADAANVVARALAPHKGVLFYRGFVYDHLIDWRNPKNDRARAAVDNFKDLDGRFDANVIVQIKNGPIDFQVREPASPLFAALPHTKQAIELQITQEYLGQQRHVVFLPPMWKETLDFDMRLGASPTPVSSLVSGYVGVSNVGRSANWLGHDLAMANLYGFGRLAWQPNLQTFQIADEWTRTTFGPDTHTVMTIDNILLQSWLTYEHYTGNLGIGTLTDIIGAHYGPGIESSERNGWGQWHRADGQGVGMDRTSATGTGFIAQYPARVAATFESLSTTPDELLLFMHHVPYTHVLKSGETVIQHIYDDHYSGAEAAAHFVDSWRTLDGFIDRERYASVLAQLEYQAGHAVVWRDAITNWFRWISGIPDARNRVGRYPNRTEAEAMRLDRFAVAAVTPWETASGGQAIRCPSGTCTASMTFSGVSGAYDIVVQYFDENDGASRFSLFVGNRQLSAWMADDVFPSREPNGHTSTRRVIRNIQLKPGDVVRIEAAPDKDEFAVVDYVEIVPRRSS